MAETFEGPVTVKQAQGGRETVVSAGSILLGHAAATATRKAGFGIELPVVHVDIHATTAAGGGATSTAGTSGTVVTGQPPAVPDVSLDVGDTGLAGGITVRDRKDEPVISLNGMSGLASFGTGKGAAGTVMLRAATNGPVILATGKDGRITFMDAALKQTLVIDGVKGDIELLGADCAEDFEVMADADPGSVLCVDEDGLLHPCSEAYDPRVVGVVSGAGGLRPGVRLNREPDFSKRATVALVGKVFCLADADVTPINVGDLLTTSARSGHAMKASDRNKAFGSVLGKSLGSLSRGCGLVPVLVALQ